MASDRRCCGRDVEIMTPGLACDQLVERSIDGPAAPGSQHIPKFDLLVMTEAAKYGAGRRHADPVAAVAEIARQGGDEAESQPELGDVEVARRPTRTHDRRD